MVGGKIMRNLFKKIVLLTVGVMSISSCSIMDFFNGKEGEKQQEKKQNEEKDNNEYVNGTYKNALFVANTSGSFYSAEIADPCVVRDEKGEFWSFSTCRRVLHSVDGCEWEKHSDAIIPKPQWGNEHFTAAGKGGAELWAPDVVKIGDKWIYYYSISDFGYAAGIGYATADQIGGPYTDHGRLFWSEETGEAESVGVLSSIDQQIIFGDDGHIYMVLGSFSKIWMIQLTDDGLGLYSGYPNKTGIQSQREN